MMSSVITTCQCVVAPLTQCRSRSHSLASPAIYNRYALLMLFVVIAAVPPAVAGEQQPVNKADWKIEIVPGVSSAPIESAKEDEILPAAQASVAATQPADVGLAPPADSVESAPEPEPGNPDVPFGNLSSMSYLDVYRSIPFIRAEYDANPSYRHDATMEILFGQLRPTVVHKYSGAPHAGGDYTQLRPWYVRPYWYRRNGRRMNYNFYYPYPTVYRRY